MSHETILKMIEEVSADDTAKLDEIDARVWCYVNNVAFKKLETEQAGKRVFYEEGGYEKSMVIIHFYQGGEIAMKYTRSRDALKAIRPEGWEFSIRWHHPYCVEAMAYKSRSKMEPFVSCDLVTEELAELHAIIQAIAYERAKA